MHAVSAIFCEACPCQMVHPLILTADSQEGYVSRENSFLFFSFWSSYWYTQETANAKVEVCWRPWISVGSIQECIFSTFHPLISYSVIYSADTF